MYCAVTGSSNTVSVPSVTVVEYLVQVTVVYSRSSSGDTGEGELIIRVQSEVHTTRQLNMSCIDIEMVNAFSINTKSLTVVCVLYQQYTE